MTRLFTPMVVLSILATACSDPVAPVVASEDANKLAGKSQMIALPIEFTFKAENPCSNNIVIYKIAGTAFTNRQISRREVLGKGSVRSNDGFYGFFDHRVVFTENRQVIEIGEFETVHEDGRLVVMTITLLYTDGAGQPTIGVEQAKPVRCAVESPAED